MDMQGRRKGVTEEYRNCAYSEYYVATRELRSKTKTKSHELFQGNFDPPPPRQEFLATPLYALLINYKDYLTD